MTGASPPRSGAPPRLVRAAPAEVVLVGAHGGAGTSTLAVLLRPAWDAGAVRDPDSAQPLRTGGRSVLLVTSSTVTAAARAIVATTTLTRWGTQVAVWSWSATACPSRRPGTGSGSCRAVSAPSSACRSSRPSARPGTRPRWTCPAARAGPGEIRSFCAITAAQ